MRSVQLLTLLAALAIGAPLPPVEPEQFYSVSAHNVDRREESPEQFYPVATHSVDRRAESLQSYTPIRNAGEKRDEAPQTYGKLYLGAKRDAAENEAVPTIYTPLEDSIKRDEVPQTYGKLYLGAKRDEEPQTYGKLYLGAKRETVEGACGKYECT